MQILNHAAANPKAAGQARAMMQRQLGQMVRLIDDLLDVSRISRGKIELQRKPVDLATVVQTAVETSRPLIDAAGHRLSVRIPRDQIVLDADPTRLGQVFSNLLNNAAKFTPSGGDIELTAERRDRSAVVSIKDSGQGIPSEMLSQVFEMFTQVDRAIERPHGGLGIGLTLVKRLVELHGGRVHASSDGPGCGSTFVVTVPISANVVVESEAHAEDAMPNGKVGNRKVLIADDNTDAAESLAEVLSMMGDDVCTANDGLDAIAKAEFFRPDVVLLDIGMPNLNGYDACRRLREQSWGSGLTIVAITGWGQEEDRRRSKEAGFDRHLVKPIAARNLVKVLDELCAEKGLRTP
jgi:CheY-like chemotaxis protein